MTQLLDQYTITDMATTLGGVETRIAGTAIAHAATPAWLVAGITLLPGARVEEAAFSETTTGRTDFSGGSHRPTSDLPDANQDMALLESAAQADNGMGFVTILKSIHWETRPAEDYIKAIRLALAAGFHPSAWEMVDKGAKRFPDHPDLQKMAKLFAPARVIHAHLPPNNDAAENIRWLKENRGKYQGKWVALKGSQLLAVGESYHEVIDQIGNPKGRGILITVVY